MDFYSKRKPFQWIIIVKIIRQYILKEKHLQYNFIMRIISYAFSLVRIIFSVIL